MSTVAWGMVGVLALAYVINYVDRQVVFSIFPVLRRELGFTDAQLGLIGSIFTWVYSLCMPLAGRIADVVRRDRLIVGSMILWSLATLGTAACGSVAMFLFFRALMGVTESLYVPAALGLIGGLHSGGTRSRALSLHAMGQFAGIVAGGWYGGWMAETIGWREGFMVLGVIGIGYAVVLLAAFRRMPQPPREQQRGASAPLDVFRAGPFPAVLLAFFFLCVMLWMLYAWLPNFIYTRYHLSLAQSGLAATLFLQASSAAGVLLGGALGDAACKRYPAGRFYVAGLGLLLCAPFAWLTLAVPSLAQLKVASAGFGLFAGLMMSNYVAAVYDVISERNYGFAVGALNLAGGLSGGAAIFLTGLWQSRIGIAGMMWWAAAAAALSACVMMIAGRRYSSSKCRTTRN